MSELNERDISNIVQYVMAELNQRGGTRRPRPACSRISAARSRRRPSHSECGWRCRSKSARTSSRTCASGCARTRRCLRGRRGARPDWDATKTRSKRTLLNINKVPGIEDLEPMAWSGDRGLTLIERAPFGVCGSITPGHQSGRDRHRQFHRDDLRRQRRGLQSASEREGMQRPHDCRHQSGHRRSGRTGQIWSPGSRSRRLKARKS